MVDKRFVEQSDVLSDLESRPNLMELNPFEFEHLVANLFAKMGLRQSSLGPQEMGEWTAWLLTLALSLAARW